VSSAFREKEKIEKLIKCKHCGREFPDDSDEIVGDYCDACWKLARSGKRLRGRRRCKIADCENWSDQGQFVGDLCCPCWDFATTCEGKHSQAYRNSLKVLVPTIVTAAANFLLQYLDPTGSLTMLGNEVLEKRNSSGITRR
jgi:hypothetical protein